MKMSDIEKFNVDSDLQSIADAMTISGLNFCGGVFDHLETGEEFELTIAKKSSVRSMAEEIAELQAALELMILQFESDHNCEYEYKVIKLSKNLLAKLNQEGESDGVDSSSRANEQ